jgi:site-specific DNA-cytosine methylase
VLEHRDLWLPGPRVPPAHADRQPTGPRITHSRHRANGTVDPGTLPCVSMAEALDWPTDPDDLATLVRSRVNDQTGTPYDATWPAKRPAAVIATRPLVTHPGANANRFNGATKSRNDGIKVTVAEAGLLQSFPADFPWVGSDTDVMRVIGNAVPPLMGEAILAELIDR